MVALVEGLFISDMINIFYLTASTLVDWEKSMPIVETGVTGSLDNTSVVLDE